jgi:inositol-phosphate phosphatase/L-galactose 1-phosphate phosphatase/histidinol-phosphatase
MHAYAQVHVPLYGCDCYAYGLLAAGFCDLVVEAGMKPYDYMALVPVVRGAGGTITDWKVRHQAPPPAIYLPGASLSRKAATSAG